MPPTKRDDDIVDHETTRQFAVLAHQHFGAVPARGLAELTGTRVGETLVAIQDVSGDALFHDYALTDDGGTVRGTIRCAANKRLGVPVVSISHGAPGWDSSAAVRLATEALHKAHPGARATSTSLVCYAYPKIGVKIVFQQPNSKKDDEAIFDASSGGMVESTTEPDHQFTSYSMFERLSAADGRARRAQFQSSTQQIREHFSAGRPLTLPPVQTTPVPLHTPFPLQRQGTVLLSPWCPNSPPGNSHYAQITDYFCVDASAQMLLEHYGWNYTQNQIAAAMGTNAAQGGTTGAGLTSGFASLTDKTLLLSFDDKATRAQMFQDAVNEITANRPLFTQVPHHYRVCMGYQESLLPLWGALGLSQSLYIYDPWPWNPDLCQPGAPYWESWAVSPVMWFGVVHHA